jgi:hypothetical protein
MLWIAASTLMLAACGKKAPDQPAAAAAEPNQRRIDTAIANSKLPGAGGVSRAMGATDAANAQTRMQDSILNGK